jgi:hypothetical protein
MISRRVMKAAAVILLALIVFVAVRVPGWLRPQEPEFAIVHQSRRYVKVGDFARGAESRDLVYLHEYAILAAEVYGVNEDLTKRAMALGWTSCESCRTIENQTKSGLRFRTWLKTRADGSRLAAVAFRGTRAGEVDDLKSNIRWVTRLIPGWEDEYDVVQKLFPGLLAEIDRVIGHDGEIVTTGHSLGGGLAQQAGYLDRRVSRVYAFDPSPVTGYYDLDRKARREACIDKRIYRIYEHGEILAYLRLLLKGFYPVADRDPEIVELRFNLTHGNFITQHSMADLAKALDKIAANPE